MFTQWHWCLTEILNFQWLSKEYWHGFRSRSSRAADQGEEIEEGELLRGEVGPNIAPMEEEIGGEEGGDEEEGWVMGPNTLPLSLIHI